MYIVERFALPSNVKGLVKNSIGVAIKNIIAELSKLPTYKLLPNINDYGHGHYCEIPHTHNGEEMKIGCHQYDIVAENGDTAAQYELSIEYELC